MAYLIDSDVFIQAKDRHYGLDFCPAFWDWLVDGNRAGKVFSVEAVADELTGHDDELKAWAADRDESFFLPPTTDTLEKLRIVNDWITSQQYEEAAINTFMQAADYFLIAQALVDRHVVVTHEVPSNSVNKIKIPNVCIGLKIKCINPFTMLRLERARFVLPQASASGATLFDETS